MRYLLYLAILGASLWILTEFLELLSAQGTTPLSLWLTAIWHPILAAGFWGLHRAQSFPRNKWSMAGVILIIISLAGFAPVSILILQSGTESFTSFLNENPVFKIFGLLSVTGYIIFCYSMIRTRFYPGWLAYGLLLSVLLGMVQAFTGLPEFIQHIAFISLSFVIIVMSLFAIRDKR